MTIYRFKFGILLLLAAILSGGLGWWLHPRYIDYKRVAGEREATEIAKVCALPDWALYFDYDGRRQSAGRGPSRPESVGIYMQSSYAVCPTPDEKKVIACAKNQTEQRGYRFQQELRYGEECEND